MSNPIETAVMPLKMDAVARAEEESKKIIENVRKDLEEHGNDLQLAAPYPRAWGMGKEEYMMKINKYKLYSMLVTHKQGSRKMNDPDFVELCPQRIERYIEMNKENAATQYDAFVAKLVSKIGEVQDAELNGNHVWGYSILTVTKTDGDLMKTQERWKTQQIVNRSKNNLLFNQWPTRKVK